MTELVLIQERSGSVSEQEHDTIGGFHSTFEQQKRGGTKRFGISAERAVNYHAATKGTE